jgi:hypothetical protein
MIGEGARGPSTRPVSRASWGLHIAGCGDAEGRPCGAAGRRDGSGAPPRWGAFDSASASQTVRSARTGSVVAGPGGLEGGGCGVEHRDVVPLARDGFLPGHSSCRGTLSARAPSPETPRTPSRGARPWRGIHLEGGYPTLESSAQRPFSHSQPPPPHTHGVTTGMSQHDDSRDGRVGGRAGFPRTLATSPQYSNLVGFSHSATPNPRYLGWVYWPGGPDFRGPLSRLRPAALSPPRPGRRTWQRRGAKAPTHHTHTHDGVGGHGGHGEPSTLASESSSANASRRAGGRTRGWFR